MGSLKRGENMFEEMTIYYENLVTSKEKLDFITDLKVVVKNQFLIASMPIDNYTEFLRLSF